MQELIEIDALKNHLYRAQAEAFKRSEWDIAGSIQSFIDILEKQPTIEAEPVRHGRWIALPESCQADYECSECGAGIGAVKPPYCALCGARMDGGDNDVLDK